jgi:precorrin-3B synthase
MRRGACPGLEAPMQTGDGLLIRFLPAGTMTPAAFTGLCAAAHEHGSGVMEITARGSIQVRGLDAAGAQRFAAAVAALGVALSEGVPVHCDPLAGLGPGDMIDAGALAADLQRALNRHDFSGRLSPKVSVAIDGGGLPGLAGLAADIRLCAQRTNGDVTLHIAIGGTEANAISLGAVAFADGVEAAVRLLEVIVRHGRASRARNIVAAKGMAAVESAISDLLVYPRKGRDPDFVSRLREDERRASLPIGAFRLRNGSFARGVGLAFGHSDATALTQLAKAATAAGATGFRTAPGRAMLAIGLAPDDVAAFSAAAARLGFIVDADDPRRHVVACAGAPICAAAHIASRALASVIVETAAAWCGDERTIHISGCGKGCARAAPAALTIVGTSEGCALVADGRASDTPFTTIPVDELPAAIVRYVRDRRREAAHA